MGKLLSRIVSPQVILGIALLFTVATLLWLVRDRFQVSLEEQDTDELTIEVEKLRGEIVYFDEVLTMSARLAALTGDLFWEERYRQFEPKLDSAIKEVIKIDPESKTSLALTDQANQNLVEMEHKAFDLTRQGQKEEAQQILFSKEYDSEKKNYAYGISLLEKQLKDFISISLKKERKAAITQIYLLLVATIVLVLTWLFVLKIFNEWQKIISVKNQELSQKANELSELNLSLDGKVKERTKELEISQMNALEMMQNAKEAKERVEQVKEILSSVISHIPQYVYWKGLNSEFLGCNESFAQMVGLKNSEEVIGKTDYDFTWNKEIAETYRLMDQKIMESGRPILEMEAQSILSGEKPIILLTSKIPLRNDAGKAIGMLNISADITERKRSELERKKTADELKIKLYELNQMLQVTVDRELRMVELKKEVNKLCLELNRKPPYDLSFTEK